MNLSDLKASGTHSININDSLSAPLLRLSVSPSSNNSSSNTLNIYVSKNSSSTSDLKTYSFTLRNPLKYYNNTSDEFIIEPLIEGKNVTMKAYVIRRIGNNTILAQETKEFVDSKTITLFEGNNYIYTNYSNATINIIYPKNIELVKYFLNNTLFTESNNISKDDIYFKDAFTKENDNINASFNNLEISCLTSKNNNFSLDSDGNLIVNSITAKNETSSGGNNSLTFNDIYPVGSIYLGMNSTNPATYFGGSWNRIAEGRTLVGVNTSDSSFRTVRKTGGEKTHTLTIDEMPEHRHQYRARYGANNWSESVQEWQIGSKDWQYYETESAGGGYAHNNLQPYLTCYIWERTA
ncbi:MAG: hypothetical protein NC483_06100 [Ruminococcus sp.]|nr:hypothetical protein [Ruminococcus sp.]